MLMTTRRTSYTHLSLHDALPISLWNTNAGTPIFTNAASGIFNRSVATGQFNFGWAFTNNGTMNLGSGTLNMQSAFNNTNRMEENTGKLQSRGGRVSSLPIVSSVP